MGNSDQPLRIVVSGGIGSGKSTIGEMLRRLGVMVIDADQIGHEVLEPEGAAFAAVAERWPAVVVDGSIDRGLLAAIVFADGEQLELLESLTHPHIRAAIEARVERFRNQDVAVELPLLDSFLSGEWTRLVVVASPSMQMERAVARGMSEEDTGRRMAAQPEADEWRSRADYVIVNNGSLADLQARVDEVWLRLASDRPL
jgi:dephospho-CoA kinase